MNKTWLCLVGLILVSSYFQIDVTGSDSSSYDIMTDINRDRTIDVNDLNRLGRAYGSNLVLPSEPGKTVVTVLSFDREPPEVENARVAAVDPDLLYHQVENPINVTYTNSSGIATFDLSPSNNYTAIAWSGSAYNYVNFTKNLQGDASVLILLGEPSMPPLHALPQGWIVITFIDNTTGSLYFYEMAMIYYDLEWVGGSSGWSAELVMITYAHGGVFVTPPYSPINQPYSRMGLGVVDRHGDIAGCSVYSPDKDGCANVVVYVTPP